ncbi:MAG: ArsA family ATPase [Propionibacteriaceae bacterium]
MSTSRRPPASPWLDADALLADPVIKIMICCGSGGVGKTTTSAALAVRAAEQGRKVCVLTIDPARRLAQSLGLGDLDNTPRPVEGIDTSAGGSLDAMMLDMKRTFDDVVLAHSSAEKADQILTNPFYQALSTSFSGTQEYMAMEKLGQLHTQAEADGRWDLIIVDTPPARSALDFLDAPEHLSSLLDGRLLRLLLAPARGPFKIMSMGFNVVTAVMHKVLGAQIITDVQTFVNAFEALFGGFRVRAQDTFALLSSRNTTFVVVATAERDATREAAYFVDRLSEEQMPLAGVIVNRVHSSEVDVSPERALSLAEDLADHRSDDHEVPDDAADDNGAGHQRDGRPEAYAVEIEALQRHAARMRLVEREAQVLERFSASRRGVPRAVIQSLPTDVADLPSLRLVGRLLAQQD